MNLRALLVVSSLLSAGASYAQDACVADDPATCTGSSLEFCNAQLVTETFDCATIPSATCGDVGCVGTSASCVAGVLLTDCVGGIGGPCIGASPLFNQDTTDDANAFGFRCAGDATCITGPNAAGDDLEDTCIAHVGPACALDTESACVGDSLVFCRKFIENAGDTEPSIALVSNNGLDCAALGGTCNPTATFDDGTTGPNCEFPDTGEGEGEGAGTEGEGENNDDDGNSRDQCENDSNCEAGQTCSNGVCIEPAPSGCFNASGMLPAMGPVALILLALRRRRRAA